MSRAVPKIGEKVVIYSVWPCGAEQNFAHGVFFKLAYRPLVGATVIYMRASLLHFKLFKIRNIVSENSWVEHQSMY